MLLTKYSYCTISIDSAVGRPVKVGEDGSECGSYVTANNSKS